MLLLLLPLLYCRMMLTIMTRQVFLMLAKVIKVHAHPVQYEWHFSCYSIWLFQLWPPLSSTKKVLIFHLPTLFKFSSFDLPGLLWFSERLARNWMERWWNKCTCRTTTVASSWTRQDKWTEGDIGSWPSRSTICRGTLTWWWSEASRLRSDASDPTVTSLFAGEIHMRACRVTFVIRNVCNSEPRKEIAG